LMTGRRAFVELLADEGVTHVFGNPGTTELAIMDALADCPQLRFVLGLQESIVVGMADGYARASGRLAACNLHCMPGLGHAVGALYNAQFARSPIIVTAGQYELGYGLQEPTLYRPLVPAAEPVVKWAVEVERAQDLPRVLRRAAKVATTAPAGPVFISLPGDILDQQAPIELGRATRVLGQVRPGDDVIAAVADALLRASRPVIVAGAELAERDAFDEAAEFAELLGAPVYLEPVPYNTRFPSAHPANMGDLTRNQPRVRAVLERHDLLVCLGADLLRMSVAHSVDPLPPGMPVIHLCASAWELGKNYPTDHALCADVKETLRALIARLRDARTPEYRAQAAERLAACAQHNWVAAREAARAQAMQAADSRPVDPRYLSMTLADALPPDAIVIEEAPTTAAALATFVDSRDPRGFLGLASGGLGFAMPGAVGAALARAGQPVVALVGDGSALYTIQSLWTAAHLKLPITWVVVANGGYRIIRDRMQALRGRAHFDGMSIRDPTVDFVAIAQGFGVSAQRIGAPGELGDALRAAFRSGAPRLIEVTCA
ncbi:MAG TPA: thiamine pyrophosphate-dependent enzyme, partial [Burkholderiaceae bacterium]|nr:thiamine pyrophosphate-dependent enzyme [Burkholderiaceae bacterium]